MKRAYKYAGLAFAVALLAACATNPWETINVPINAAGWKMGYGKEVSRTGWIKEFVRPPETVDDWTRLITLQFFENTFPSPRKFMDHLETRLKDQCRNVDWHTISSGKQRILYEWEIHDCPGHQDQHEISLILLGDFGLYRAAYTQRGKLIDPATRTQWIQWLSEAKIIKEN